MASARYKRRLAIGSVGGSTTTCASPGERGTSSSQDRSAGTIFSNRLAGLTYSGTRCIDSAIAAVRHDPATDQYEAPISGNRLYDASRYLRRRPDVGTDTAESVSSIMAPVRSIAAIAPRSRTASLDPVAVAKASQGSLFVQINAPISTIIIIGGTSLGHAQRT
jgi:hypothetical protein